MSPEKAELMERLTVEQAKPTPPIRLKPWTPEEQAANRRLLLEALDGPVDRHLRGVA